MHNNIDFGQLYPKLKRNIIFKKAFKQSYVWTKNMVHRMLGLLAPESFFTTKKILKFGWKHGGHSDDFK